jgi:hypothetical protein
MSGNRPVGFGKYNPLVRLNDFRSFVLKRTSGAHSKIHCSRVHGGPPPWNV